MKKILKMLLVVLVLLVFVGTFVFLWKKSQPQPEVYEEIHPEMGNISKTTIVTGKIEPRNEVSVKPQISGIITELLKEAGDQVTAGEVIAKVKVIPDMNQLSSSEARVRLARINLEQAKTDYERYQRLWQREAAPKEKMEGKETEYKAALNGVSITVADRFYPSSKTCSHCGAKKDDLTLKDRTFICPECGHTINRDLNAALNLLSLIPNVGADYPELTPADLTALHSRFTLNGIATSKVETGRQRKL